MPSFGTSGLRGLADELTDSLCARYANAFVRLHKASGSVLIGRDLRASTPRIAEAVARGVGVAGQSAVDCGVLPTPALALAAEARNALAIMVTGSHIPADRNGLKFYTGAGEITKADEADLLAAVDELSGDFADVASVMEVDPSARDSYVARFTDFFPGDALHGLRIGVWQQSSAAREVLPEILRNLGATVVLLDPSDVFIPIDTEAVDPDLRAKLVEWVREYDLHALVSTDGDADRPMVAEARGRVIPGDILGPLTARHLGATQIVTPVSSNTLVEKMDVFTAIDRCRIGSPYVIAAMEARRADPNAKVLGYEPNGGVLLGFAANRKGKQLSPLMTRDSALPIIAVLAEAAAKDVALHALVAELPQRRTATDRLQNVPSEISRRLAANLVDGDMTVLPDGIGSLVAIDTTDGARLTFESGNIVTVRPSGNAPELRCYIEADSDEEAQRLLRETLANLRQAVSGEQ